VSTLASHVVDLEGFVPSVRGLNKKQDVTAESLIKIEQGTTRLSALNDVSDLIFSALYAVVVRGAEFRGNADDIAVSNLCLAIVCLMTPCVLSRMRSSEDTLVVLALELVGGRTEGMTTTPGTAMATRMIECCVQL